MTTSTRPPSRTRHKSRESPVRLTSHAGFGGRLHGKGPYPHISDTGPRRAAHPTPGSRCHRAAVRATAPVRHPQGKDRFDGRAEVITHSPNSSQRKMAPNDAVAKTFFPGTGRCSRRMCAEQDTLALRQTRCSNTTTTTTSATSTAASGGPGGGPGIAPVREGLLIPGMPRNVNASSLADRRATMSPRMVRRSGNVPDDTQHDVSRRDAGRALRTCKSCGPGLAQHPGRETSSSARLRWPG